MLLVVKHMESVKDLWWLFAFSEVFIEEELLNSWAEFKLHDFTLLRVGEKKAKQWKAGVTSARVTHQTL